MAKSKIDRVYDIAFTKRDEEIRSYEYRKSDVEEDLAEAVREFARLSRRPRLRLKKMRVVNVLRDDKDPNKLK